MNGCTYPDLSKHTKTSCCASAAVPSGIKTSCCATFTVHSGIKTSCCATTTVRSGIKTSCCATTTVRSGIKTSCCATSTVHSGIKTKKQKNLPCSVLLQGRFFEKSHKTLRSHSIVFGCDSGCFVYFFLSTGGTNHLNCEKVEDLVRCVAVLVHQNTEIFVQHGK
jgi:hypothetical protein